jgi:hypothetical protein
LIARLTSLAHQDGLEAIGLAEGVDAIATRVVRRVIKEWQRNQRLDARSTKADFLRSALVHQASLRAAHCRDEATQRRLPGFDFHTAGTDAAQDLWVHLVTVLLPAIDGYGDARGEKRVMQDLRVITDRLLAYSETVHEWLAAFFDLAEWFHVPPAIDEVCNAALLWCYWNAFDPRQRIRQVFVEHARDRDKGQMEHGNAFATFSPLKQRTAMSAVGSRLPVEWLSPCGRLTDRLRERIADGCWRAWDEAFVPHTEDEEMEVRFLACAHLSMTKPGVWQNAVRSLCDDG